MRIQVIINSRSRINGGDRLRTTLQRMCPNSTVRVAWTACAGHATALARDAVRQGFDTVVAVGGDGTVNEIVNCVIGTPVRVGIVPAGTANDLASYYGIPSRIEDACAVIARGYVREADVVRVNGWRFLTAAGVGFPCRTLAVTRTLRQSGTFHRLVAALAGRKLYVLSSLLALLKKESGVQIRLRSAQGTQDVDLFSLVIGNQPKLGQKFHVTPGAVNDDGQLDVCVIENGNGAARQLRVVLATLRGRHASLPEVRLFRTSCLAIESSRPLAFFGDGEIALHDTQFDVRVMPKAVRILTPRPAEED